MFRRLTAAEAAVEATALWVKRWWQRWWLRLSIGVLLAGVWLLLGLWWFVGKRAAADGPTLISFLDSLVGIGSIALAGSVTIATAYSASLVARTVRMSEDRHSDERSERRMGRVEALVGASLEAGAHASWLAEVQKRGMSPWGRWIPQPAVEREVVLSSWRQLTDAAVAASKALERIRYDHPDLAELAGKHFDLVVELQRIAGRGDADALQAHAARIRGSADSLWDTVALVTPEPQKGL